MGASLRRLGAMLATPTEVMSTQSIIAFKRLAAFHDSEFYWREFVLYSITSARATASPRRRAHLAEPVTTSTPASPA